MALWLLLASLALVCPGLPLSASEVPSEWPRIRCRSSQMETFTCYWNPGDFSNGTDLMKLQYRTSDMNWRDCPDSTSGGENSCFFSKEHASEYFIRLHSENATSQLYNFTIDGIVEPDPPVSLSWSLQNIRGSGNNSLLDIHVTWEPPPSSTAMLLLEYEVQIKAATEQQWNSYDVVTTTYLPVYGLKAEREYLLRVRCRLHGNEKFGEFSEELVIPVFVSALESKGHTTSVPRISSAVNTTGPAQKDMKKTYPSGWPTITQCRSPQQETFTCHWTYGNFYNLSGSLRLQYKRPYAAFNYFLRIFICFQIFKILHTKDIFGVILLKEALLILPSDFSSF